MKSFLALLLLFWVVLGLPFSVEARYRMGNASVVLKDGVPCFTMLNDEFERAGEKGISFGGLALSGKEVAWAYNITPPKTLRQGDCMLYGFFPETAIPIKQGETLPRVAPPFQLNQVYSLVMFGSPNDSTDPTHSYSTDFCLTQQNGNTVVVRATRDGQCTSEPLEPTEKKSWWRSLLR